MSKHGKATPRTEPAEDSVRLKPVLGLRPGTYLTAIYALVVLLVAYLLLFYPGVRRPGSYLVIRGVPDRATVLVDGKYAGTSPCTIFLPRGGRAIEINRPFFTPLRKEVTAPGRVFATLIVPQKRSLAYRLDLTDLKGLASRALTDFIQNPAATQLIPYAFQDAGSLLRATDSVGSDQIMSGFLNNLMYFVTTEQQLRATVYGLASLESYGGPFSVSGLVDSVDFLIQLQAKYSNLGSWLILALSDQTAKEIERVPWIAGYVAQLGNKVGVLAHEKVASEGGPGVGPAVSISGITFRSVPSGTLLMGREDLSSQAGTVISQLLPHPVRVNRFYLAETEITNSQFAAFLDTIPQWRPSNRQALVDAGVAGPGYLEDWTGDRFPSGRDQYPVTGISWNVAQAYCQWLTARARASSPGATVRLPTEAEYEWAARGGLRGKSYPNGDDPASSVFYSKDIKGPSKVRASSPNGYGLFDMAGNVWEWCEDAFTPDTYLLSSFDPVANRSLAGSLPPSDEKVVRGGAWSNQKELMRVYVRGAQPASWSTPYLGFRPALILP